VDTCLFTDLAREAGAADPERLAAQLVLLYDGASVSAQMDHARAPPLQHVRQQRLYSMLPSPDHPLGPG